MRGGETFAPVAVGLGFAVGLDVFVVNGAVHFPHGFPGRFIQRDDELRVAAVEGEDEQVLPQDRRASCASEMVADKVPPLPQHLAARGVQRGDPRRAEAHVDAPFFDGGSGRAVAVELVAKLRRGDIEQFLFERDFPRP